MKEFDLAILGGGISGACAAYAAASKTREAKKHLSIALISDEEAIYSRGALPSLIGHEVNSLRDIIIYPISQLKKLGITFYKCHEVLSVDFKENFVWLKTWKMEEN